MGLMDYLWFLGALLICSAFAAFANGKVNSAFRKYNGVANSSNMTGYDTVVRLMKANGVMGINVGRIKGRLTDHYHPLRHVINLSESTYGNNSVAAVAVAAHEMGHVMQHENGYWAYRLRSVLVPVVNFGARLALPLVIIGVVLELLVSVVAPNVGFYVAMVGVIMYGGSFIFALVTLPVELNASRRATQMLVEENILTEQELPGAKKVLSAAALTYLASLLVSLVYFLRFLIFVLALFGKRD